MKKWIMLGILAVGIFWFFWNCCVVASDADDRMEEMMLDQEVKKCSEMTDEHGQN